MTQEESVSSVEIYAVVEGQPVTELPQDLFIPPNALEVLLDSFSGPLDFLLYLIRRQNIDILNIPIMIITRQYMQYIALMKGQKLELASDYLVMAALLAEIKSRMLLPARLTESCDEPEEDPRAVLVRRLQVYEQFKLASILIDQLTRQERDTFPVLLSTKALSVVQTFPDLALDHLGEAMSRLLNHAVHLEDYHVARESISVRERMGWILQQIEGKQSMAFSDLLQPQEGRMGLVVNFLAILELSRQSLLLIFQASALTPIYITAAPHE